MRDRNPGTSSSDSELYETNERIRAREVRLIGSGGEQIGVVSIADALKRAEDEELDLVEVAPNASPPVCKLLDYGKLKYREQKKAAEARKKGATNTVKEIRVRYSTDAHDLETKVRNAKRFLSDGDRVRFLMRFRGREVVYKELGEDIFKKIIQVLQDSAVVEEFTPLLGQRMIMTLAPK